MAVTIIKPMKLTKVAQLIVTGVVAKHGPTSPLQIVSKGGFIVRLTKWLTASRFLMLKAPRATVRITQTMVRYCATDFLLMSSC